MQGLLFLFFYDPHAHSHSLFFQYLGIFPGCCAACHAICDSTSAWLTRFDPRSSAGNGFIPLSRSHLQHIGFDVKATCGFIKTQLLQ